jgi:hypothetical protein
MAAGAVADAGTGIGVAADTDACFGITIFGDDEGLCALIMAASVNRYRQRGHSTLVPSR